MKIIGLAHNGDHALLQTVRVLDAGGVCVVPTDTVYGIVADAGSEAAIEKLAATKEWRGERSLLVFMQDIAHARQFAYISDAKARFLEKIWPGAVTVLFQHKGKLAPNISGGDTIGMRMSGYSFVRDLLEKLKRPLVQTSANISGGPPAKNIAEIFRYFEAHDPKPDLIIDGGEIAGAPSTIINFVHDMPLIIRSGVVTKSDLDALLGGE